jgi:putative nucleotidyltransferase with HDIG domain
VTLALDALVERVERIPRLPDTAMRLVSVVVDPSSSIKQIVDTMRYDQAVTSDVLRLCNSAYFGLSRRVTSLEDAICLLGTVKVLQLVMSAHTQNLLSRQQEGYGLPPGALWEHSVAVAVGCELFARRFGLAEMGRLFTTGLLHDLGKVVLNEFISSEYAEIARRVSQQGQSFVEAERDVLGFTHADVGARVGEAWALPEAIIACIRYHHCPSDMETEDPYVDAVHLADSTCLLMGIGGGEIDGLAYRVDPAVLGRRGLNQAGLETIGAEIVTEVKAVRKIFAASS